jgi:hypothetical protein
MTLFFEDDMELTLIKQTQQNICHASFSMVMFASAVILESALTVIAKYYHYVMRKIVNIFLRAIKAGAFPATGK